MNLRYEKGNTFHVFRPLGENLPTLKIHVPSARLRVENRHGVPAIGIGPVTGFTVDDQEARRAEILAVKDCLERMIAGNGLSDPEKGQPIVLWESDGSGTVYFWVSVDAGSSAGMIDWCRTFGIKRVEVATYRATLEMAFPWDYILKAKDREKPATFGLLRETEGAGGPARTVLAFWTTAAESISTARKAYPTRAGVLRTDLSTWWFAATCALQDAVGAMVTVRPQDLAFLARLLQASRWDEDDTAEVWACWVNRIIGR